MSLQPELRCLPPRRRSRRITLTSSCLVAAVGALFSTGAAHADGVLFVASSRYSAPPNTIKVGQALPSSVPVTAVANAAYPDVFNNAAVDGSFGITSPIYLSTYTATQNSANSVALTALLDVLNVTAVSGITTSFSSKSELAVHLSTNGRALTMMGYVANPNVLDVSNSNTPDNVDPSNTDIQTPTYRAVVQVNLTGVLPTGATATPVDSYSGNNGRGAILANDANRSGVNEYLMVGNAGNGSGIEPTDIVNDTGVQTILPGSHSPVSTVIGMQQGTPGQKNGFEYGFAVAELGYPADKSGKDDNFRGIAVFDNKLFVSKGSGGNGIDTVYQVTPGHSGLPVAGDGPTTQISILPGFPTGLASAISETDPSTEFYPFGLWFANATTLYVADEGSQDLNADPNAGLQKWLFDGKKWTLAYTIQNGLNLDQPYTVANYPSQFYPATTGLRHVTGVVVGNTVTLFASTATYSNMGDPGGDPNAVVRVVDQLDAKTLPATAKFTIVEHPSAGTVYRGVAYTPVAP